MVGGIQGHRDGVAHLSPREVSTLGGSERQVHAWWGCSAFVYGFCVQSDLLSLGEVLCEVRKV